MSAIARGGRSPPEEGSQPSRTSTRVATPRGAGGGPPGRLLTAPATASAPSSRPARTSDGESGALAQGGPLLQRQASLPHGVGSLGGVSSCDGWASALTRRSEGSISGRESFQTLRMTRTPSGSELDLDGSYRLLQPSGEEVRPVMRQVSLPTAATSIQVQAPPTWVSAPTKCLDMGQKSGAGGGGKATSVEKENSPLNPDGGIFHSSLDHWASAPRVTIESIPTVGISPRDGVRRSESRPVLTPTLADVATAAFERLPLNPADRAISTATGEGQLSALPQTEVKRWALLQGTRTDDGSRMRVLDVQVSTDSLPCKAESTSTRCRATATTAARRQGCSSVTNAQRPTLHRRSSSAVRRENTSNPLGIVRQMHGPYVRAESTSRSPSAHSVPPPSDGSKVSQTYCQRRAVTPPAGLLTSDGCTAPGFNGSWTHRQISTPHRSASCVRMPCECFDTGHSLTPRQTATGMACCRTLSPHSPSVHALSPGSPPVRAIWTSNGQPWLLHGMPAVTPWPMAMQGTTIETGVAGAAPYMALGQGQPIIQGYPQQQEVSPRHAPAKHDASGYIRTLQRKQSPAAAKSGQVTELVTEPTLDGSHYRRCSPNRPANETSMHTTKHGACGKPVDRSISSGLQRFRDVSTSSLASRGHFVQANPGSQRESTNCGGPTIPVPVRNLTWQSRDRLYPQHDVSGYVKTTQVKPYLASLATS